MRNRSLGVQWESCRIATPTQGVCGTLFVGYSPYLGHMTHDVYPGVKNLITAGHSYEAQNSVRALMFSIHRIHQNIYLCGAQQRDILSREPVVPHSHSHSVSVSHSACCAEHGTLAGEAFLKMSRVV